MDTEEIPNLVQGVTQQAPQQARSSQCLAQFDCINDASSGAGARPCSELVTLWAGRDLSGSVFSETEHDGENYLVGIDAAGVPYAIDLSDGTDCTMTVVDSTAYLTGGSGPIKRKLRSQVADDYTFIANREVTPAMASTTAPAKVNEALIFVRSTQFNTPYTVSLSGPGVASASAGTSATEVTPTKDIASFIASGINGTGGYSAQVSGSIVRIWRSDNAPFTVATSDGTGDDSLIAFNGQASSFSKLPARGFPGMVIKVAGDDKTSDDDYFVKYEGASSTGIWRETVGPGAKTTIDPATMPHAVVNVGYRSFEFRRNTWSTRVSGDGVDTAKDPAFIGKRLRDVFYHQRRLGIAYGGGAVFSKAKAPFTFFPDTVQTQLPTAPVDVQPSNSTGRGATTLDFAVQVAEKLYLWAQRQQHSVTHGSDGGFKQESVSIDEAASYEYSPLVDPMSMGPFLYFSTDVGDWATLRALTFNQTKISGDVDLSAHVPSYVPSGVFLLTGAETLRSIFVLSEEDPSSIFVFNFLWDGEKFIQQAFNTWRIPGGDILWAGVRSNYLRVLQQRPEGVAFLRFNLTPKVKDPVVGAKYSTRLDIRRDETGVSGLTYNAVTDTTSFTLPYTPTGPATFVVVREDKVDGYQRGRVFEVVSVVGAVVTVKGNLTGYKFYVGQQITAERTELEFFLRGDNGAVPVDTLTINHMRYALAETGYSRLEVTSANGKLSKYEFQARVLGGPSAQIGSPPIVSGVLSGEVGHYAKDVTIRIVNDSFLPSYWQNAAVDYTAVGWKGRK